MNIRDHVTGKDSDGSMWLCGNIVKELVAGLFKGFNTFGLMGGSGTLYRSKGESTVCTK